MADVRTPELVINKLTKQQYENIQNPSDTEIYLVLEDEEHKPICYPTTASEVGATSMLVKSSVSDNGKILTENGFVYNTSGNPTISDTKVICDLGVGKIEKSLSGLTMNTTYYIKSYGINQGGTSYGDLLTQATNNSPIPQEYQLVEYLHSETGTAYIRTGISSSDVGIWRMKQVIYQNPTTNSGSGGQIPGAFYRMGCLSDGRLYLHYGAGGTELSAMLNDYAMHEYEINMIYNIYKIDNVTLALQASALGAIELYLFISNGAMNRYINSAIAYCEFYNLIGEVTRKFYPVYRIADNKPGMYDIVNGVFYTNQGTGEFTVGPDKEFDE